MPSIIFQGFFIKVPLFQAPLVTDPMTLPFLMNFRLIGPLLTNSFTKQI